MPYRGPQPQRIAAQQQDTVFLYGGYQATWKHYISASAGASQAAGLGPAPQYTQTTITALFGVINSPEEQTQAGVFAAATIMMTTREKMTRQDDIIWRGIKYSVESDPSPDPMTNNWLTVIDRRKG